MVSHPMWLSISHSKSVEICNHRIGMLGYSVGHSDMLILSTWPWNVRSIDRSKPIGGNLSEKHLRSGQSAAHENERKSNGIYAWSNVGPRQDSRWCPLKVTNVWHQWRRLYHLMQLSKCGDSLGFHQNRCQFSKICQSAESYSNRNMRPWDVPIQNPDSHYARLRTSSW